MSSSRRIGFRYIAIIRIAGAMLLTFTCYYVLGT